MAVMVWVGVRVGRGTTGAKDYLLGARDLPWWALLLSIVATETSTVTFLSTPGIAFGGGLAGTTGDLRFLQLPLGYLIGRLVVVRWLLPLYFRGEVFTAYQVLSERFGGGVRKIASGIFLVTRTLADGLRLYLTALVVQALLPIDLPWAVIGMGILTLIYTYFGGMRAVVWTDVLQFAVYMAGAVVAFFVLLAALPGGAGDIATLAEQESRLRLFDFSTALDNEYTFWAGLLGGAVLSIGSHGVDQLIVQRYLAARNQAQAAAALSLSGVIVLAQFAFFLVLGLGLAVFYQHHTPAAPFTKSDQVFLDFIVRHTPTGVLGLVLGAVFSAAMSTLSSSLNSSASALINDIVQPLRGCGMDDPSGLRLARLATLLFGALQIVVGITGLGGGPVVSQVLGIASLTTGILLGVYALGTLTTSVGQGAALIGMAAGLGVDLGLKFGVGGWLAPSTLAWPWYGLVGSTTTFVAGLLASHILPRR
ncbi:MAG: sodium/solute symporter [Planctomycetes bacterium]|nr:sodium/solute symporter [Planctomycetota bacterium]